MAASTVGGGAKEIGTLLYVSGVPIQEDAAGRAEMETQRRGEEFTKSGRELTRALRKGCEGKRRA